MSKLRILLICAMVLFLFLLTSEVVYSPQSHAQMSTSSEPERVSTLVQKYVSPHTVLFTGDLMLARAVEWAMDEYGCSYPFTHMHELFTSHTHVVTNFEGSIPILHVPTPAMNLSFSVDETCVSTLQDVGITHAGLANNHSYDFGYDGYTNTKQTLEANNLIPFGKPYTLSTSSVTFLSQNPRIALIAIDLTLNAYTAAELSPIFEYAKSNSDTQIVYVHWGNEYALTHSRVQEQYAKLFVAQGADLIVGHHPHVVQDIQRVGDVLVFYSLGNFVFDQYFSNEVQEGMLLSFDVDKSAIKLIPITSIASRNQPRVMPAQERAAFLEVLAKRSEYVLGEDIREGELSL